MEGRRFVVFVKLVDSPGWQEHLTFFRREDAEAHVAALRLVFPRVEECTILERASDTPA